MLRPRKTKTDFFAPMEDDIKQFWGALSGVFRAAPGPLTNYAREEPRELRARLLLVGSLAISHRALTLRLVSVTRQLENDWVVHFFCKLLKRLINVTSELELSSSLVSFRI